MAACRGRGSFAGGGARKVVPWGVEIFVATDRVDLRLGIERLGGLVRERMGPGRARSSCSWGVAANRSRCSGGTARGWCSGRSGSIAAFSNCRRRARGAAHDRRVPPPAGRLRSHGHEPPAAHAAPSPPHEAHRARPGRGSRCRRHHSPRAHVRGPATRLLRTRRSAARPTKKPMVPRCRARMPLGSPRYTGLTGTSRTRNPARAQAASRSFG
jgi:hypothetical protein